MFLPLCLTALCATIAGLSFGLGLLPDWVGAISLCAGLAALLLALFAPRGARPNLTKAGRPIAVDGSNLLYWKGDRPDLSTVAQVLRQLEAQGRSPKVWFDANVGYLVSNRYLNGAELAQILKLDREAVTVAAKGEPADPLILAAALKRNLQVLSNDRYRDWHESFPGITEPGRLLRGGFVNGQLRLDPAFAPKAEIAKPKANPLSVPGERRGPAKDQAQASRRSAPRRREPRF